MSLLPATSHITETTPFWARSIEQVTVVSATRGTGTATSASAVTVAEVTFRAPSNGLVVGQSNMNVRNTASTAGLYTAQLTDIVSGGSCSHSVSLAAGNVSPQAGNVAPMQSIGVSAGQVVTYRLVFTASNGTSTPSPAYTWDWSVLFYPTI